MKYACKTLGAHLKCVPYVYYDSSSIIKVTNKYSSFTPSLYKKKIKHIRRISSEWSFIPHNLKNHVIAARNPIFRRIFFICIFRIYMIFARMPFRILNKRVFFFRMPYRTIVIWNFIFIVTILWIIRAGSWRKMGIKWKIIHHSFSHHLEY